MSIVVPSQSIDSDDAVALMEDRDGEASYLLQCDVATDTHFSIRDGFHTRHYAHELRGILCRRTKRGQALGPVGPV